MMTRQINTIILRTMTFLSTVSFVLIMTAGDLHAQQDGGQRSAGQRGQRRGEQMMKRLVEDLELNQDQEMRIREITTDAFDEVAKNRDTYGGDRDAMMEASRDLITKMNKDIEEVLSKDQQVKFREMRRDFRRQRDGQGKQRGGQGEQQKGNNSSRPSE